MSCQHRSNRTASDNPAVRDHESMGETRWYLFNMMGDENESGSHRILSQVLQPFDEVLSSSQVESSARLIEKQEFRVSHE